MRNLFVFLGAGMRDPHHTGALLPSSRALARAMVSPLADARGPRRVLEVGAGTGVVTGAILDRLDSADTLVIYELNPALRQALERSLARRSNGGYQPRIRLVGESIETIDPGQRFDFIISGLPLNNFEPDRVDRILRLLAGLCVNGGTLTYFEYAGIRALRRRFGGLDARLRVRRLDQVLERFLGERRVRREFVLWNVPPAWVRHLRQRPANPA